MGFRSPQTVVRRSRQVSGTSDGRCPRLRRPNGPKSEKITNESELDKQRLLCPGRSERIAKKFVLLVGPGPYCSTFSASPDSKHGSGRLRVLSCREWCICTGFEAEQGVISSFPSETGTRQPAPVVSAVWPQLPSSGDRLRYLLPRLGTHTRLRQPKQACWGSSAFFLGNSSSPAPLHQIRTRKLVHHVPSHTGWTRDFWGKVHQIPKITR
ncbi:hypothetical protein VTI74DRAFT_8822 [Chaetomium olivicolor]